MELDIVLRKIPVLCAFCKGYKLGLLLWFDAGLCFMRLRKKVVSFERIFWTFLCTSEDIRTLWIQQSSWFVCAISGHEVGKNCALLGYYAASSGSFFTDVSVQPIGPFFRGKNSWFLTHKFEIDRLSRIVRKKYQYLLRNNPEEHNSLLRWFLFVGSVT